ncbi:hypothetical protein PV10_00676 [Exophiala mesophila]|uniref:tripeptidyl-peptidase II n=1 Tax=Exophiala mesophila TaxID=212818 RepID=A0A0D1Y7X7_EXOME|nr:uncharacterized protein PV10_00676 [Exophiala mesophila]KIV96861.1 hypothetical protein PV10_00676 [Exophiala mesophila]
MVFRLQRALLSLVLFSFPCLQSVSANPVRPRTDYAVKDFHPVPPAWSNLGSPSSDHMISLSLGLTQSRFEELEKHLYEVSDPFHARYGQHLTAKQVHDLVKPSEEATHEIHKWLHSHGIEPDQLKYSPAKDWISITLPLSKVEELLDTKYFVYQHNVDGSILIRTEGYSLPRYLHKHVSTIQPTNSWARLGGHQKRNQIQKRSKHVLVDAEDWTTAPVLPLPDNATVATACNFTSVTPDCLRTLYGTLDYEVKSAGVNKMAHTNYLDEATNRSDISIFLGLYRPEAQAYAYEFEAISIDGGVLDNGTNVADEMLDLEANLDAEYMIGIGYPTPLIAYHTGGRNPSFVPDLATPDNSDEPFLEWANWVLEQDDLPQVISTSYGDDEQTVSRAYAQATCNQFAQLGARGVTLFFASGDSGVGDDDLCYSNKDNTTYQFLPSFPASCPYVTVVGATRGYPESAAWRLLHSGGVFTSGAGFSKYFDRPEYQAKAVSSYVKGLDGLYDGLYNPGGRAYPDLSCIGQVFPTIWNGSTHGLVGTSGSSPICAAVFALLNDALITEGRPPVGFLNPWLYAQGHKLFTDVTNGSSSGCNTTGFPATPGWDAVTGWGTPYLPKLLKAFGLLG